MSARGTPASPENGCFQFDARKNFSPARSSKRRHWRHLLTGGGFRRDNLPPALGCRKLFAKLPGVREVCRTAPMLRTVRHRLDHPPLIGLRPRTMLVSRTLPIIHPTNMASGWGVVARCAPAAAKASIQGCRTPNGPCRGYMSGLRHTDRGEATDRPLLLRTLPTEAVSE